MNSVTSNLFVT